MFKHSQMSNIITKQRKIINTIGERKEKVIKKEEM